MIHRRVVAALAVIVLVAGGCGSDKRPSEQAATTTVPGETTTTAGDTITSAPAAGTAGEPAGASGGRTTTTAAAGGTGATTAPPSRPAGTAAPAPIAPGGYSYRQSGVSGAGAGTAVPARGTLTVDPPRPDGTQVAHRVIEPSSPQDYTLSFRPDGLFITSTEQTFGGTRLRCDFSPPLPAPPWPPAVGSSFSGRGECGTFTAEVGGRITGERQVTVDGSPVRVVVVESTIVTRGQVESTGRQVDWFAPDLRLVVHEELRREGRFGSFPFVVDVTSDLESARPS